MTNAGAVEAAASRRLSRTIAIRIFLTCWLVYALHFATNIPRELYPALALGDHFSFRVDEYANLHPDLFEKEGYGWHIGNNPGASMVAAIPYALSRPLVDFVVERVSSERERLGVTEPPEYSSPWPMAREFYAETWRRGLDVKLGLAAFVTQVFCMAPSSALGVVVVFFLLRRILDEDRTALWMSLLYAFGTPIFMRTGFLNHNLMLGHLCLLGFSAMWSRGGEARGSVRNRYLLGGLTGGAALLFDYSGVVFLLGLFLYGVGKRWRLAGWRDAVRNGCHYVLGSVPPVGLLWLYQWRSFGHPFYPGQHWMPPVEWIDLGYQGYGWPQFELLTALVFDYRFGLFVTCPMLLLGIAYSLGRAGRTRRLPGYETAFLVLLFLALWVFFAGSNYTRLQFNTGIRYMIPIVPFLFIPTAAALARLRPLFVYATAVLSLTLSWCLAMVRDVENGPGILNPVWRVLTEGFQLPAVTTAARLGLSESASPLALFALTAALLYAIWSPRFERGG